MRALIAVSFLLLTACTTQQTMQSTADLAAVARLNDPQTQERVKATLRNLELTSAEKAICEDAIADAEVFAEDPVGNVILYAWVREKYLACLEVVPKNNPYLQQFHRDAIRFDAIMTATVQTDSIDYAIIARNVLTIASILRVLL